MHRIYIHINAADYVNIPFKNQLQGYCTGGHKNVNLESKTSTKCGTNYDFGNPILINTKNHFPQKLTNPKQGVITMKTFEVFLELINGNRRVGRTSVEVQAESPFSAAIKAEKLIDSIYDDQIYSHTLKVNRISCAEYRLSAAA